MKIDIENGGSGYPRPSPTGKEMLFGSYYPVPSIRGYNILSLDSILGEGPRPLSSTGLKYRHVVIPDGTWKDFKWSPDGEWIAIRGTTKSSSNIRDMDLYVMHRSGTGFTRLTNGMEALLFNWSPDSRFLVFQGKKDTTDAKYPYVYTVSREIGIARKVTIKISFND
jgi:Tol biopolymer transport system component